MAVTVREGLVVLAVTLDTSDARHLRLDGRASTLADRQVYAGMSNIPVLGAG